jgi:ribose transport system permease protein
VSGWVSYLRSPGPIFLSYTGLVVLFVLISVFSPGFADPKHVTTLLIVAAFTGIAAIGQTIVIVGGGIDLSVPWTLNCAAVLLTALARGQDGPVLWIIPLILLGGVIVGIVNGVGIAILRVPPIVMTLSMNIVLQGLLYIATSGFPPPPTPQNVVWLATGRIGPFPVILVLWAILAVVVIFVERRTSFGRYLYAVGTSRTVAAFSGVPVVRTTITAYAVSGGCAALAGILLDGYARQSYLGMGDPFLFTSIAAVAIGGASILGGSGSYLGTIAGALTLTVLTGLLPILKLEQGHLSVIYGAVILVTVALAAPATQRLLGQAFARRGAPAPSPHD